MLAAVAQQILAGRPPPSVGVGVGVADVEAALQEAERLGGTRRMGPASNPGGGVVVGHFTDHEGHLIGVAEPR